MRCFTIYAAAVFAISSAAANAEVFSFAGDPFENSTAPGMPGRQVVGGEISIPFSVGTDSYAFVPEVFGINQILFVNNVAEHIPASGVNVVVLQTTDNDNNPQTAFNAGIAADLIADRITSPGPGFFIYFNSGLNLPRLVFSTDLSDNTADLKVLARMTNLTGQPGALSGFTESNFALAEIPEPSSFLLMMTAGLALVGGYTVRRKRS